MRAILLALIGLAAFSCSGIKKLEFYVSAIDANEKEIPCAVFFDDRPVMNEKDEPILTPAWITFPFNASRTEEKIGVRAVEVSLQDGKKTIKGLGEGESSPYLEDSRLVRPSDAKRQLFVLRKNKTAGP